jgi:hypothetical protein
VDECYQGSFTHARLSLLQDVHMFIYHACQGTVGSRYIESRRYELDDAETNEVVVEQCFDESVEDGKVFEVAILMRSHAMEQGACPSCGLVDDRRAEATDGGWVRWYLLPFWVCPHAHWPRSGRCHVQLSQHVSNGAPDRSDENYEYAYCPKFHARDVSGFETAQNASTSELLTGRN